MHADAYTAGNHVVFGRNRYQTATEDGRRLIAHELAHVAQQADAPAATPEGVGPSDHPSEREADHVADAMMAGDASVPNLSTAPAPGGVARVVAAGSVHCTTGKHGAPADALGILDSTELLLIPSIVIAGADLSMLRLDIVLPGLTNYQNRFGLPPATGGGRFKDRLGGGTYTTRAEALYHEAEHVSDRFYRISDYAANTVIDYRCIGGPTKIGSCEGHCSGRTATACQGDDRIMLCPNFWTGMGPGGRTYLLIHELAHLVFNVDHVRNFSHADCYASFASDAATAGWVGVPACRP
jgi:hypothetical protein